MSLQTPPTQSRNLWDYIKSGLSSVTSNPVSQGVGSLVSKAFDTPMGRASKVVAGKLLTPFEFLAELEGERLKGNAARENLSEIILPNTIGGYTATKAERQKASEKISIGRASLVRIDTTLEKLLGRNINAGLSPLSYDPQTGKMYNVYEDAQREKYMEGIGLTGNIVTGATDLIYGTVVSPFIALGALGKVARLKTLDKPLTTERVVAKKDIDNLTKAEQDRFQYLDTKNKIDELDVEDITVSGRTADEVMAEKNALEKALPSLKAKADKASEDLSKIGYANGAEEFYRQASVMNAEQLLKHRVVKESSDPELLAGLLGETDNIYEIALITRAAAGDIRAQRLLAAESTSTFMALQRAKQPLGEVTNKIKAYKQTDGDLHELALLRENKDILVSEYKDLLKKDAFLDRAVRSADQKVLEGRSGPSTFASIESFRAGKARVFGEASTVKNWDVEYFQRNPFVATVAVVTWPFRERPANWVRTKGMNTTDSVKELEAFMQNVSGWTGVEGASIRASYIRRYTEAPDEIARERVVKEMEVAAIRATGKKNGLTAEQADSVAAELDRRRGSAIAHFRDRGFLIDENNEIVKVPQLSSQLADSVPLMDIKKLDSALKNTGNVWRTAATETKDMVIKPLDLIDEIWRPAVLFRLGYTQRNVFEGWGRVGAALGGLTSLQIGADLLKVSAKGKKLNVDGAMSRWYKNRHAGLENAIAMRRSAMEVDSANSIVGGIPATGGLPPLRVSWDRIISLQEDAITLNATKLENLKDLLKGTPKTDTVQRASILDEIKIRQAFEKEAVIRLNGYAKQASKKGIRGNRYSVGQGYIHYGGYDNLPLTFQDDAGDVLKVLSGTQSRINIELQSPARIYGGLDSARHKINGFKELHPGDPEYFVGLARVLNRQFRNSETIVRLMRGDSIENVIAFLRTQDGRKELRAARYTDPEEYAIKMQYAVERYIPDVELRARLANEKVSPAELRVILGGRKDLRSIHGDSIKEVPDLRAYEKYTKFVRGAFRYLGALPEDTLVRHPFANAVYQKALRESIDNANKQGVRLTNAELNGIFAGARRKALQETRRTLYTIERHSNASHLFRFLEPFFMAAQNTGQAFSKLAYRDPRLLGLAGYIYNAPDRAGIMQTDPLTGREIAVMQIPDWMRKGPVKKALANQAEFSFEKGNVNLILQGQDWWRVGDGVFAQVAASQLLKNYPAAPVRPILDYVMPFGPSRKPLSYDILLPTITKRLIDALQETDSRDYNSSFAIATRIEDMKYRQGLRDEPTPEEIKQRVDAFTWLRVLSSATLPVSVKFRPEFQFYIDQARKYREKYGVDAAVYYYQDFPDYFEMYFSISKNPSGMDATADAIRYKNKYQNLVDKVAKDYPEFTQLITNSYGAPTKFDNTAYIWQFLNPLRTGEKETIRQPKSATEIAKDNNLQRGWIEYTAFKNELDSILAARMKNNPSITSYQSKGAEDLSEARKLFVAKKQTENETWWRAYNEAAGSKRPYFFLKAVETVLNDKKFMADRGQEPVWDAFNEYIKLRKEYTQVLKIRGNRPNGSSSLQAVSNKDLLESWSAVVEKIKTIDSKGAFTSFYNRFLDNDTLEEIK